MKILYFSEMIPITDNESSGAFLMHRINSLNANMGIHTKGVKLNNVLYSRKIMKNYFLRYSGGGLRVNVINYAKIRSEGLFEFAAKKLFAEFEKMECDILHAHFAFPEGYIAYRLMQKYGKNYVLTVHGSDIHTIPYLGNKYRKMTLFALEGAKHVIFVSEYLKNIAEELGYSGDRCSVIPNGVDMEKFPLSYEHTSEEKIIGFVGSLIYRKGADMLPSIIKNVLKKETNVKFEIVGEGILRKFVEEQLKEEVSSGKVKFYGFIKNELLSEIMGKWKIIILPSRKEGTPTVLVESMAMGLFTVSSNYAGSEEIITQNNGIRVSFGLSFESNFAEAILSSMSRRYNRVAIKEIASKYDIRKTVRSEVEVYSLYAK